MVKVDIQAYPQQLGDEVCDAQDVDAPCTRHVGYQPLAEARHEPQVHIVTCC